MSPFTTTKIENHDDLILGTFRKYHCIGIYNDTYKKRQCLLWFFVVLWHFSEASLFDVAFISGPRYTRALYGSVIVVVFYKGAYIYIYMFQIYILKHLSPLYEHLPNIPSSVLELNIPQNLGAYIN